MNLVRKLWPTPFKVKEKDVGSLIVQLIIFLVICTVAGFIIGLLSAIPIVGIIFSLLGSLMGLYSLIGIVLCIVKFLGAVK